MAQHDFDAEALDYHERGPKRGKLEIQATKPMTTQRDLSLAYTPGVAEPCRVIARDPDRVFDYTARGNLVAVVSNGTAVLGLGNIGPLAAKPVMEGKAVLFKRFADIDVFDIEIDGGADTVITVVKALAPTFGGVNLEDIKAPECFVIEETLQKALDIPIFHDDQHGTAIISGAALLNALALVGKDIAQVRIVVSGAGAAAISCARLWIALGVDPQHILMTDSHGVLTTRRQLDNPYKAAFARDTPCETLADAMRGADVFVGLSVKGQVDQDMVRSMADRPILFALANPDPEITYPEAIAARPDAIMATGRSDYPNQVNNVLGFPFIFRGALDVRATCVNEAMKLAAVRALAELAREPVPATVSRAYGGQSFSFGPTYIIPKPFDPRVLVRVASAVARAAIESGVARKPITDWDAYQVRLERMMDPGRGMVRVVHDAARRNPKRLIFTEGSDERIVRAAGVLAREGTAHPVLMGQREEIARVAARHDVDLAGVEVIDPVAFPDHDRYVQKWLAERQRRGLTAKAARHDMLSRTKLGLMMVREGEADGILVGGMRPYGEALRPALRIVGADGVACGLQVVLTRERTLFFADCTVNVDPDAETLAAITRHVVAKVRSFGSVPHVAMLSFASYGAVPHEDCAKMARAAALVRASMPDLSIDGEVNVDVAVDAEFRRTTYPWSRLAADANVFVFPNLAAANIAFKLMDHLGHASVFGPLLLGMRKPVCVLPIEVDASRIVDLAAYTAVEAEATPLTV